MPCRSDYPETDRLSETRAQLDAVTKELCRTQAFVYRIHTEGLIQTGLRQFGIQGQNDLQRILRKYKEHREKDKARAVNDAKGIAGRLLTKINQIQQLGGVAGDPLQREYDDAAAYLKDIQDSDPLDTKLY